MIFHALQKKKNARTRTLSLPLCTFTKPWISVLDFFWGSVYLHTCTGHIFKLPRSSARNICIFVYNWCFNVNRLSLICTQGTKLGNAESNQGTLSSTHIKCSWTTEHSILQCYSSFLTLVKWQTTQGWALQIPAEFQIISALKWCWLTRIHKWMTKKQ